MFDFNAAIDRDPEIGLDIAYSAYVFLSIRKLKRAKNQQGLNFSVGDTRKKLKSILKMAAEGQRIEVKKHGKPVATFIGNDDYDDLIGWESLIYSYAEWLNSEHDPQTQEGFEKLSKSLDVFLAYLQLNGIIPVLGERSPSP